MRVEVAAEDGMGQDGMCWNLFGDQQFRLPSQRIRRLPMHVEEAPGRTQRVGRQ
jgi:hypothetical protein